MRALALILSACGLLCAACGVTTVQPAAFTQTLIGQVGAGSVVLANSAVKLKADENTAGALTSPATEQATAYLTQGRLDKLSVGDLTRIASANRAAATYFPHILATIAGFAASIRRAMVSGSSYRHLSDGSRTFIADWDEYLTTSANSFDAVRRAFIGTGPVFNDLQSMLRAAYDTSALHSAVQFDKVRRSALGDVSRRFTRMQSETASAARSDAAAERKLVSFVNRNQEAQAIVTKVNQRYRNGILAGEFKAR